MTVAVAPREIHDLAYRASRVAGCDAGIAERIADNVTFAEICHGGSLRPFCEALAAMDLPRSAWATAPDGVLSAEVESRRGGDGRAVFDRPVPLAAMAGTLWQSLERGSASVGVEDGAPGDTMLGSVELREADDTDAAARRERVAAALDDAHRFGVEVERACFNRLEAAAAGFLVAESTLDAIE